MALRASAISKRTKTGWILRDITFTAETGAVFGIFGPAGAGKSTLLRVLAGHEKPANGTFAYERDGSVDLPKRVQFVGPTDRSFWHKLLKSSGPELSRGEEQISAIENALASDAGVLLLDDAFCHLDRGQRSHLYSRIREHAAANNICVVAATADFNEVLELCDAVTVLSRGEVAADGLTRRDLSNTRVFFGRPTYGKDRADRSPAAVVEQSGDTGVSVDQGLAPIANEEVRTNRPGGDKSKRSVSYPSRIYFDINGSVVP